MGCLGRAGVTGVTGVVCSPSRGREGAAVPRLSRRCWEGLSNVDGCPHQSALSSGGLVLGRSALVTSGAQLILLSAQIS